MLPVGFSLDSLSRYPTTDWMKEMFRTGKTQNYDLNISDSNETSNYYIGGHIIKKNLHSSITLLTDIPFESILIIKSRNG